MTDPAPLCRFCREPLFRPPGAPNAWQAPDGRRLCEVYSAPLGFHLTDHDPEPPTPT